MLTNKEFELKLERKDTMQEEMQQTYDKYASPKYSKKRIERARSRQETIEKKTGATVSFEINTDYYRAEYEDYFDIDTVKSRIRNLQEYYVIQGLSIAEIMECEQRQMLQHYKEYQQISRKCFNRFLNGYVVVDNGLMLGLIEKVSQNPKQAYKMRKQWERTKREKNIGNNNLNLTKVLREMTDKQKNHIRGMHWYNNNYIKSIEKL